MPSSLSICMRFTYNIKRVLSACRVVFLCVVFALAVLDLFFRFAPFAQSRCLILVSWFWLCALFLDDSSAYHRLSFLAGFNPESSLLSLPKPEIQLTYGDGRFRKVHRKCGYSGKTFRPTTTITMRPVSFSRGARQPDRQPFTSIAPTVPELTTHLSHLKFIGPLTYSFYLSWRTIMLSHLDAKGFHFNAFAKLPCSDSAWITLIICPFTGRTQDWANAIWNKDSKVMRYETIFLISTTESLLSLSQGSHSAAKTSWLDFNMVAAGSGYKQLSPWLTEGV